ncbi:hypothetical protein [Streptomyces sp. NPDC048638]|uniref:hypothetical protein n=1 Tax=Streptomyces sp. NPDC048638 TaxID=3365580 RepID=UPI0037178195
MPDGEVLTGAERVHHVLRRWLREGADGPQQPLGSGEPLGPGEPEPRRTAGGSAASPPAADRPRAEDGKR